MAVLARITEGRTQRLTFTLQADGSAIDGTGITVSNLYVTGARGKVVDTSSDFGWVTAASGTVYYDPDAADFEAAQSPYKVRFELTDGSGKVAYHPEGEADTILVSPKR